MCALPLETSLRRSSLDHYIDAARCCVSAPAADMDLKAATVNGTDRQTDGHPTVALILHR